MKNPITITVKHPDHLEAHRGDFFFPLERILEGIAKRLEHVPCVEGEFCEALEWDSPVGLTGLKVIEGEDEEDFWGYRLNRSLLSHLIVAEKKETASLCCWGSWVSPGHFLLHTCYPGLPAPREIHDPSLTPGEMKRSVQFWSRHAIIVAEGEFTL